MSDHFKAAIHAAARARIEHGGETLESQPDRVRDAYLRAAERQLTAAWPHLRKAIIQELASEAEKEWTAGIVGNIVPRTPFEAEEWLRAKLTPPDFPEFAQQRSMDGSLTSERVKSTCDLPRLHGDALPIDELNRKLGWRHE